MLIFKRIHDIQNYLNASKKEGQHIGFVPTMGALHKGHISLLKECKKGCDIVVCSIFVNPTQFNDKTDFEKYPNTLPADIIKLSGSGCDVLFLPSVTEMYPEGYANDNPMRFGFIAQTLEGEHRPGHFDGMAQVVEKLLDIVKPGKLYMGQKDYQQQLIVQQLIKKIKLNTELIVCPTLREKDGLAMSSRNVRLSKESRKKAAEISRTLRIVKARLKMHKDGIESLEKFGFQRLADITGLEPEYFAIRNAFTLETAKSESEKLIALTAVRTGGIRLIDNMRLN